MIGKYLQADMMTDDMISASREGTPQGGRLSAQVAELSMNRRIRNRTYGGVGGRRE